MTNRSSRNAAPAASAIIAPSGTPLGTPPGRRELLLAPLLAALPVMLAGSATASPIDPTETILRLPEEIAFQPQPGFPPRSVEMAPLWGASTEPGLYLVLIKWYPGYMSAPHTYLTDRLCVVLSGTWMINSGADFDPDRTVAAPAGSFVRRVAGTPHYDGVKRGMKAPAVIALCGLGPGGLKWLDPGRPGWRAV